jgi:hypothetical protein
MAGGDSYSGALFLAGLEILWREREEEVQKLNANIVKLPAMPWFPN